MTKKEVVFDEAMLQLENIVRQLEQGDVPLENAIELYQKGMELSKLCSEKLQSAEKQLVSFHRVKIQKRLVSRMSNLLKLLSKRINQLVIEQKLAELINELTVQLN